MRRWWWVAPGVALAGALVWQFRAGVPGKPITSEPVVAHTPEKRVLPALHASLKKAGIATPDSLMDKLFGNAGRMDGQSTLRQQSTLQILMPIGRAILEAHEGFDPLDMSAELEASFGDLLPQRPTGKVLD